MQKVKIQYTEKIGNPPREEVFDTGPYWFDKAAIVKENLEIYGCYDVKFVPHAENT